MHKRPDVLWLSVSPYLKCFDQRLLSQLVKHSTVRRWKYCQTIDEPCSIESVVETLHAYFLERFAANADASTDTNADRSPAKVHLIGHGVSGVVALLYARKYPQHIASLTLLSVGSSPAINWQAHYYALRKLLPCSREVILGQMTRLLFGQQAPRFVTALAQLLAKDLDSNLTLHSLAHSSHIAAGGVEVPMLVCHGEHDDVVTAQQQADWGRWLKPEDRLWHCPEGLHFFHFYRYKAVAKTILNYWAKLPSALAEQSTDLVNGAVSAASGEMTAENLSLCSNR
ncbi:MAG: alpha/beta hydrolase [Cyanobacteria bacterium J06621_11]